MGAVADEARALIDAERLEEACEALTRSASGDRVGERQARELYFEQFSARERAAFAAMAAEGGDVETLRRADRAAEEAERRSCAGQEFLETGSDEALREGLLER